MAKQIIRIGYKYESDRECSIVPIYQEVDTDEIAAQAHAAHVKTWRREHPDTLWILDQVSEHRFEVNVAPQSLYAVKWFSSRDTAIEWLDAQGADWLTRTQYNELQQAKKPKGD